MIKCKSCDGEYERVCTDGCLYFHACPPVVDSMGAMTERVNKRDENVGKTSRFAELEVAI